MRMGQLAAKINEITAANPAAAAPGGVSTPHGLQWIVLESMLLDGEHVVIVFEKRWLQEARQALPGRVLYFPPEIEELKRFKDDPEAVRAIHRVKKEFGAWLVPSKSSTTVHNPRQPERR